MATWIWPSSPVSITGVATEATLLQVEQNTEDTVTELQTLNATDFATETTLAAAAADIASLEAKDFATETTLASAAADIASLEAKDFATETTLAALAAEDFATETTLDAVKTSVENTEAKSPSGMITEEFDYQSISYVAATTKVDTIVYKLGGAGGTTVATQTFAYDGSDRLTSVTKS